VYYVSFIDDFLRNTWIYFLRKKFEVFDIFKEFKDLVENQTEKRIKVLRTDTDREFRGNEFEELCKKCGITSTKTFGSNSDDAFDAIATFYCRKTDKPRTPSNVVSQDAIFPTT
jgi:hypothetical protein